MPGSLSKPSTAVQTMLYAPAPFFCYPWKPFLNWLYGGGYSNSYRHFRMQHLDGNNLFLHCLCLLWQISSNYAFLAELDKLCAPLARALSLPEVEEGGRLATRTTSLLWCVYLLGTAPTPVVVKIASVISIYAAHNYLGPLFNKHWQKIVLFQGALEAVGVQLLALNKKNAIGVQSIGYFILRTALWKYLSQNSQNNSPDKPNSFSAKLKTALVALNIAIASSKSPLRVVLFGLYGWAVALLTGDKALYFWSSGMMATIAQGVAHRIAGEAGTLEVLQQDKFDQTSYELSHVTYFPNLLFQACYEHLKELRQ